MVVHGAAICCVLPILSTILITIEREAKRNTSDEEAEKKAVDARIGVDHQGSGFCRAVGSGLFVFTKKDLIFRETREKSKHVTMASMCGAGTSARASSATNHRHGSIGSRPTTKRHEEEDGAVAPVCPPAQNLLLVVLDGCDFACPLPELQYEYDIFQRRNGYGGVIIFR